MIFPLRDQHCVLAELDEDEAADSDFGGVGDWRTDLGLGLGGLGVEPADAAAVGGALRKGERREGQKGYDL
jgi:hypothetical protein